MPLSVAGSSLPRFVPVFTRQRIFRRTAGCLASTLAILLAAANMSGQAKSPSTVTLSVTAGGTAVTSVASGTVVTLTASVQSGSTPVTPGQVSFCDATARSCTDIHLVGTAQLTAAGTATLKFRLGPGSHSYNAVFAGTQTVAGSASNPSVLNVSAVVAPVPSSNSITSTGTWGNYTVFATVTETGNTVAPSGNVSFLDSNNGNAVLAQATLGNPVAGQGWISRQVAMTSNAISGLVADFNGDGIPDIVENSGQIEILIGNGDGTFTVSPTTLTPSSSIQAMAAGDFNNDGILDLVAVSSYSGTATVYLGKGDGTFTQVTAQPSVGTPTGGLAIADFNGDGNLDLAITNPNVSGNSAITILLGNGDGTFTAAPQSPTAGTEAYVLVAGDFNGDGKIDLAVTAQQATTLTILLGNGDGTFTPAASPQVTSYATAIGAADFDGDGNLDLIVSCGNAGQVYVLLGNGDGTFTAGPAFPTQLQGGGAIVIGDFNLDGIADVGLLNDTYTIGGPLEFLGNGDGTFTKVPGLPLISIYSGFVAGGDFDGDGRTDMAIAGGVGGPNLLVYLSEPTETVTASATISLPAGMHQVVASYPGDANDNSSTSAAASLWGAPPATSTSLAITAGGNPVTSVTPGTVVTLTATVMAGTNPIAAGQVSFCDASASSCTGIVVGTGALTSNGTAVYKFVPGPGTHSYKALFMQSGLGVASSSGSVSLSVGPAPAPVYSEITSISQAGFPGAYSLIGTVTGYGGSAAPTGSISFLDTSFGNNSLGTATLGTATPGLGWLISQTQSTGAYPLLEVAGDFNRDGTPDVAVLCSSNAYGGPYSISVFPGNPDGTFGVPLTISTGLTAAGSNPYLIAGDFNGDGKTDLAILTFNGTTSSVTTLLGNGDGTFAAPLTNVAFSQGADGNGAPGSVVAADFNGDGKLDLAVVGGNSSLGILAGNGDGSFTAVATSISQQDLGLIATGDFNGDGIPDLVITNEYNSGASPKILLGKGDGTFTETAASFTLDYFSRSVLVGDFNGDGKLDLAFSDLSGIEIALGAGDGTFKETSASPIPVSFELQSLLAGDFNLDGKLDLAGLDPYSNRVVVLTGGGDGTFTVAPSSSAGNLPGNSPFALLSADFNGDGVPDFAMLTHSVATASILLTEPTEAATATITGIAPVGAGTHNVEASYAGDSNYAAGVSPTTPLQAGLTPLVMSPAPGTYTSVQSITLSESIPGATIYYALYGTVNTNGFVQYTGPITLAYGGSEYIQAYATETGYQQSNEVSGSYVLSLPLAPPPTFSPASGVYSGTQSVTISSTISGAAIYYTTDGTPPTYSSALYSGPISVSSSAIIAATAAAPGYTMSAPASAQYTISSVPSRFIYSVAGNGENGYSGDGGPATLADLNLPQSEVTDGAGNIYLADSLNNVVRKVSAATGIITTIAGNGTAGDSGDGGPATSAQLNNPSAVAIDGAGNLFIVDNYLVIRRVDAASGIITTIAGTATSGFAGDGGPALQAVFASIGSIAIDGSGNIFIADAGNERIRKITASTGIITTIAGNGIYNYSGDGGPATGAAFAYPEGVSLDNSGNIFIADTFNHLIRKIDSSTGIVSTVAGTPPVGYTPNYGFSGDGGPATSAQLYGPQAVAVDNAGNLYIADTSNSRIREVTAANQVINTIAGTASGYTCYGLGGDGAPATEAGLCFPSALSVDQSGNVYFVDKINRVREVLASQLPPTAATAAPIFSVTPGTYASAQVVTVSDANPRAEIYISTDGSDPTIRSEGYHGPVNVSGNLTIKALAVAPGYLPSGIENAAYAITVPPAAVINTVAGSGSVGFNGINGPALAVQMGYPGPLAVDTAGNLYIADDSNCVVWMVSAKTGNISVVAGSGAFGFWGDGGLATNAALSSPEGIAVDASGNLYISDFLNNRIRMVAASTGIITTIAGTSSYGSSGDGGPASAAQLSSPYGLAIDSAGNLYIAESGSSKIRKITASTGIISTIAGTGLPGDTGDGGPATSAQLSGVYYIAVDSNGNVYVSTDGASHIRRISAATGVISTIAGNGMLYGDTGDGGPALNATIDVYAMAVDSSGNVYFSNYDSVVRRVDAATGNIARYAGTTYCGFSGDGGSPLAASFCGTSGLVINASGNLYIADRANVRIREITPPGAAATPAFSLKAGTYLGAQTVDITDISPNATIYYTTDNTTPSTQSTQYSGAITVSASETIQAIAVAAGFTQSAVGSAAYTITHPGTPVLTWATPAPIIYGTPLGSTQLDATAPVPGTFTYSPAIGTILPVGSNTLFVTFTPNDTATYTTATASVTIVVNAAVPAIGSLSPATAIAGGAGFTVTVNGSLFQASSVVYWGSTSLTTQYVSATELMAQVPASAIAGPGISSVTVQTPGSNGGTSTAFSFEVDSANGAAPAFTSKTATVSAGSAATYAVTMPSTVTSATAQCLNLPAGATCSYSAGSVTISTSSSTPKGTYQVTVVFTETVAGAAAAWIIAPFLLLPLCYFRKKLTSGAWIAAGFAIVLAIAALCASGCGGGSSSGGSGNPPSNPTHQATSSGVVTLIVQ